MVDRSNNRRAGKPCDERGLTERHSEMVCGALRQRQKRHKKTCCEERRLTERHSERDGVWWTETAAEQGRENQVMKGD